MIFLHHTADPFEQTTHSVNRPQEPELSEGG
jgi:hypothetical protein